MPCGLLFRWLQKYDGVTPQDVVKHLMLRTAKGVLRDPLLGAPNALVQSDGASSSLLLRLTRVCGWVRESVLAYAPSVLFLRRGTGGSRLEGCSADSVRGHLRVYRSCLYCRRHVL